MGFAHYPQNAAAANQRYATNRSQWRKSPQRHEWIAKIRSMPANTPVLVDGVAGVVSSTNENTLTINVAIKGRPTLSYHVKTVEKAAGN